MCAKIAGVARSARIIMFAKSLIVLTAALTAGGCSADSEPGAEAHAGSSSQAQAGSNSGASAGAGGSAQGGASGGSGGAAGAPTGNSGGGAATAGAAGTTPSGDAGAAPETNALVDPEGLDVIPHAAGCGTLQLQAVTLRQGPQNLEMYVALQNVGDSAVCSPSFSANLFNASEEQVGTSVGGLLVRGFFRLKDSGDPAACLAPRDVTMGALTDFPPEVTLSDVVRAEYFCSLWRFEADPAGDLDVTGVKAVTSDQGVSYTGTLVNGLDIPLLVPGVSIFSIDDDGRPLGVANARGSAEVPPGTSWDFETDTLADGGVDFAAYPTPSL